MAISKRPGHRIDESKALLAFLERLTAESLNLGLREYSQSQDNRPRVGHYKQACKPAIILQVSFILANVSSCCPGRL